MIRVCNTPAFPFLLRVQRSTLVELVSLLSFVAWLDRWFVASSWIKRMLTSMYILQITYSQWKIPLFKNHAFLQINHTRGLRMQLCRHDNLHHYPTRRISKPGLRHSRFTRVSSTFFVSKMWWWWCCLLLLLLKLLISEQKERCLGR